MQPGRILVIVVLAAIAAAVVSVFDPFGEGGGGSGEPVEAVTYDSGLRGLFQRVGLLPTREEIRRELARAERARGVVSTPGTPGSSDAASAPAAAGQTTNGSVERAAGQGTGTPPAAEQPRTEATTPVTEDTGTLSREELEDAAGRSAEDVVPPTADSPRTAGESGTILLKELEAAAGQSAADVLPPTADFPRTAGEGGTISLEELEAAAGRSAEDVVPPGSAPTAESSRTSGDSGTISLEELQALAGAGEGGVTPPEAERSEMPESASAPTAPDAPQAPASADATIPLEKPQKLAGVAPRSDAPPATTTSSAANEELRENPPRPDASRPSAQSEALAPPPVPARRPRQMVDNAGQADTSNRRANSDPAANVSETPREGPPTAVAGPPESDDGVRPDIDAVGADASVALPATAEATAGEASAASDATTDASTRPPEAPAETGAAPLAAEPAPAGAPGPAPSPLQTETADAAGEESTAAAAPGSTELPDEPAVPVPPPADRAEARSTERETDRPIEIAAASPAAEPPGEIAVPDTPSGTADTATVEPGAIEAAAPAAGRRKLPAGLTTAPGTGTKRTRAAREAAAAAEVAALHALETGRPVYDLVRFEPSGEGLIAGRAPPNARIELLADKTVIGTATAGRSGDWVVVLDHALPPGDYRITARATTRDSSEPVEAPAEVAVKLAGSDAAAVVEIVERDDAPR